MNVKDIAQGWFRVALDQVGLLPEHVKQESERRLQICNACEFRVGNTCSKMKQGKNVITNEIVVGCGCNNKAKSMADKSVCPASKW